MSRQLRGQDSPQIQLLLTLHRTCENHASPVKNQERWQRTDPLPSASNSSNGKN